MSDGLIRITGPGPLCPGSFPPQHATHGARNDVLNAFYKATPKNADDEMQPESAEKAYSTAAYGADGNGGDRMRLYCDTVQLSGARGQFIRAWYFRCRVCGLILPAGEVSS